MGLSMGGGEGSGDVFFAGVIRLIAVRFGRFACKGDRTRSPARGLVARRVHEGVRLHLDSLQCPVEESDDLRVKNFMEGVAIEPLGVLTGFACGVFQRVGEACDKGKMSGTLDENILGFSPQHLGEPRRVKLDRRKVIALCTIDAHWNGKIG